MYLFHLDRSLLQLNVIHILLMLRPLLWKSLSHKDELVLLQMMTSHLLLQINCQIFLLCSILWPMDKAVSIGRPRHTKVLNISSSV